MNNRLLIYIISVLMLSLVSCVKQGTKTEMHKKGLRAYTWTVPKEEFDLFEEKDLNGIMTDWLAINKY